MNYFKLNSGTLKGEMFLIFRVKKEEKNPPGILIKVETSNACYLNHGAQEILILTICQEELAKQPMDGS